MTPEEAAQNEELKQAIVRFQASVQARQEKTLADLKARLDALPGQFSCDTLDDFLALVTSHRRGQLGVPVNGTVATSAPRAAASGRASFRVSDETRAAVLKDLKERVPTKVIVSTHKVSVPWLSKFKRAEGLTRK
jgi:hypothetical protein